MSVSREEVDALNNYVSAAIGRRTNVGNPAIPGLSIGFYDADKLVASIDKEDGPIAPADLAWVDGVEHKDVSAEEEAKMRGFQPFTTTNTTTSMAERAETPAPEVETADEKAAEEVVVESSFDDVDVPEDGPEAPSAPAPAKK